MLKVRYPNPRTYVPPSLVKQIAGDVQLCIDRPAARSLPRSSKQVMRVFDEVNDAVLHRRGSTGRYLGYSYH